VSGVSKASVVLYARNTRTNTCHNHWRLPVEVAVSGVSKASNALYARNTQTNPCHDRHRVADMAVSGVSKASPILYARNTRTNAYYDHQRLVDMVGLGVSKASLVLYARISGRDHHPISGGGSAGGCTGSFRLWIPLLLDSHLAFSLRIGVNFEFQSVPAYPVEHR